MNRGRAGTGHPAAGKSVEPDSKAVMRNRISLILSTAAALALAAETLAEEPASSRAVVRRFCLSCHDADTAKGGLDLASVVPEEVGRHPDVWEKVVRRLRGRQMP